jgi:iron complex outermembrane recepter protein
VNPGRAVLLLGLLAGAGAGRAAAQAGGNPDEHLGRRISVRFDQTDLTAALARLRTIFGLPLAYAADAIPAGRRVSLEAEALRADQVLRVLLRGTGLAFSATPGGAIVIAPAAPGADAPAPVSTAVLTGVQQLDQIVVMGTPVAGGPEREQPHAVSVVQGDDLLAHRYSRTADLVRTMLPGLVLWDRGPSGPPAEIAAVRGASSFTARGVKTYVDGVELASPTLFTLIDPRSIERVEVIRGPQGAALYGSDAINGIVHVITRKGRIGDTPSVRGWAAASAGPFDREALPSTIVRQSYAGAMGFGGAGSSFQVDGNLDRVGSGRTAPTTSSWGLHGGGQAVAGRLLVTGAARAAAYTFLEEQVQLTSPTGSVTTRPGEARVEAQTVGLTAIHQTSDRWTQTLVLGYDRADGALGTGRPVIATLRQPLAATHETAARRSLRLHSTLDLDLGRTTGLGATAGFEHSRLARERGSWEAPAARRYLMLYADEVRNTGALVQGRLRHGALVVSGGLRTEWSSSFGPEFGTALASSLGASWTRPLDGATLRLRAGWGRGIRPPEPGMSRGMSSAAFRQQPNPALAPEVQAGVELGADLFAEAGSYLRATVFDQRASDLIQSVLFPAVRGGQQTYQFQNVGAIRNRGLELEAGVRLGAVGADLQFYYTRSTVDRLSPTYSGFLRVGDQLPEIPSTAGAARVHWAAGALRVVGGASFLGSWRGYDWTAMALVVASLDQPRASVKDYLIRYPAVIKPYVTASIDLARPLGVFLAVDNLTNTGNFERHNGNPPAGRSALLGLEFRP